MKIGRKLFLGGTGDEKLSHNPTDVLMTSGVILKKRMRVQELQIMGYTQEKIGYKCDYILEVKSTADDL